ncbi:hypothetical protein TNCV_1355991 [Trichonephila clavipes]|uniref:PiggyBac transposable element-derived protein domain-containing protein n=1 Tax=Trichonephila clavipes TaxID=2585209 RepID=A0A8X6S7Y9_TRICX|nr:hypothetical protein TNCV_1355991 [Trichonephila clavipes]
MRVFIGILLVTGYHLNTYERDYWSDAEDLGITLVKNISQNRFGKLKSYLHFLDNGTVSQNAQDRYFKCLLSSSSSQQSTLVSSSDSHVIPPYHHVIFYVTPASQSGSSMLPIKVYPLLQATLTFLVPGRRNASRSMSH